MKYKCPFCFEIFGDRHKRIYCSRKCQQYDKTIKDYYYTLKLLNKLGKDFIIWFTGFWEGEGSLCQEVNSKTRNYHFTFGIVQKDKIICKWKKYFKFGKINSYLKNDVYQWLFGGTGKILAFTEAMNPYIKIRKRKIQIQKFQKHSYVKEIIKILKEK